MDKPISFTANIYNTTREYIDYSRKAIGLGFGFGKSFGEYWGGSISYKLEKATIYDIDEGASNMIKEQEGTRITSSITPSIARDSRDNYLDPSSGSRNSVYVTFAGLGGTNAFIKGLVDSAWFFPVGSSTVSLRGRFGYATGIFGKELPLYERFYVGGIHTVRGLGFGEAGPRDENGDVIGGTKELIFNFEYIFPIVKELKLKGVVFFDAGNSYDFNESVGVLRYTTGLGFRWVSPIGPIEWGYNLQKKYDDESASKVEFTFGTFF
jgi:outer membrane protein insertion porin family